MKSPAILQTTLNYLLYILIGFTAIQILGFSYNLIYPENAVKFKVDGEIITSISTIIAAKLVLGFLLLMIFIMNIYYLSKLVDNFSKNDFFSPKQEFYLKRIGTLMVIYTIADAILSFVFDLIDEKESGINFVMRADSSSFWFILVIGLFFLYLSQVFESARKLKEENDFTV